MFAVHNERHQQVCEYQSVVDKHYTVSRCRSRQTQNEIAPDPGYTTFSALRSLLSSWHPNGHWGCCSDGRNFIFMAVSNNGEAWESEQVTITTDSGLRLVYRWLYSLFSTAMAASPHTNPSKRHRHKDNQICNYQTVVVDKHYTISRCVSHQMQTEIAPDVETPTPATRSETPTPATQSEDLYCICRTPWDGHTFMIFCDGKCAEWFHGTCVNISQGEGMLADLCICKECTTQTIKTTYNRKKSEADVGEVRAVRG